MIGVQVSLEGDSRTLLKLLAQGLGQDIENDRLALPAYIGQGFCKAYTLGNGISAMISECCYKIDFVFRGGPSVQPVFVLQYDLIENCDPARQEAGEGTSLPSLEHADLIFQFTNQDMEQPRHQGKKVRSLRVLIHASWMETAVPDNPGNQKVFSFLDQSEKNRWRIPLGAEERIWLKEVFTHEHRTAWDDFYSVIRIKLLLEKFVFRLKKELSDDQTRHFSRFELERLRRAEQRLMQDFSEPAPTISQLARESGMSPSKFKTDFRQLFGLPVYQYYQHGRMLHARRLLENNKMTIKEAGMQVGYTNLSHFSVAFKKEFGILPSELQGGKQVDESGAKI